MFFSSFLSILETQMCMTGVLKISQFQKRVNSNIRKIQSRATKIFKLEYFSDALSRKELHPGLQCLHGSLQCSPSFVDERAKLLRKRESAARRKWDATKIAL